mgnify:CR=1 FL=1
MPAWLRKWIHGLKQTRRFHPTWILLVVLATLMVAGIVWILAELASKMAPSPPLTAAPATPAMEESTTAHAALVSATGSFTPPDIDDLPDGDFGEAIRLGRNIFIDTQTYARAFVGNGLKCVNCHLDAGRKADSSPLWGAYGMFPMYREKNSRVNTYEDRLAGCFRFSMNGREPPRGSKELVALMSYSFWMSKGAPIGVELKGRGYPKLAAPALPADETRGKKVYEANCVICHGTDGQGTRLNDGSYAFPPLWGKDSFNAGAGMTQIHNAAAFIRANMPLGQGNSLTPQQAWDVAKFMNSHPRPADPRRTNS